MISSGVKSRLFEMVCAGMPVEVLLSKWVEDFAESGMYIDEPPAASPTMYEAMEQETDCFWSI